MQRTQHILQLCLGFAFAFGFFGSLMIYRRYHVLDNEPLFSGLAQLTVLTILVGLGVYLRQVSLAAADLRYSIMAGKIWYMPNNTPYAEKKKSQCEKTVVVIAALTPFLLALLFLICCRIVWEAYARMEYVKRDNPGVVYVVDLMIAWALLLLFSGLLVAHFLVRRGEADVTRHIRENEAANLALVLNPHGPDVANA